MGAVCIRAGQEYDDLGEGDYEDRTILGYTIRQ